MSNVHDLDAQRPHLMVIGQKGNIHVVPVKLIENLVSGLVSIADTDQELIRDILADWLTEVQDK